MERNFETMVMKGEALIEKNPRFDLTMTEMSALKKYASEKGLFYLISRVYYAGVTTGQRIEKKRALIPSKSEV